MRTLPDSDDMVVQCFDIQSDSLLCVACGWEGVTRLPAAPWTTFMQHPCEREDCRAQYGRNPDLCYLTAGHRGPHNNRYGTTWAQ